MDFPTALTVAIEVADVAERCVAHVFKTKHRETLFESDVIENEQKEAFVREISNIRFPKQGTESQLIAYVALMVDVLVRHYDAEDSIGFDNGDCIVESCSVFLTKALEFFARRYGSLVYKEEKQVQDLKNLQRSVTRVAKLIIGKHLVQCTINDVLQATEAVRQMFLASVRLESEVAYLRGVFKGKIYVPPSPEKSPSGNSTRKRPSKTSGRNKSFENSRRKSARRPAKRQRF